MSWLLDARDAARTAVEGVGITTADYRPRGDLHRAQPFAVVRVDGWDGLGCRIAVDIYQSLQAGRHKGDRELLDLVDKVEQAMPNTFEASTGDYPPPDPELGAYVATMMFTHQRRAHPPA